ncbi:MAG: hypothetical protein LBG66_06600, partial [Gallionellaceae bacterium]|nr:hypothetical protein [Gallionellaceae bacterium]
MKNKLCVIAYMFCLIPSVALAWSFIPKDGDIDIKKGYPECPKCDKVITYTATRSKSIGGLIEAPTGNR